MNALVLATNNRHKVLELKAFLQPFDVRVLTTGDFPGMPDLVEDGVTFRENALKKARAVFAFTQLPSLADDSGLEVFFLNGRPGVYSARYAGEPSNDNKNNKRLLAEMRGVAPRRRHVQFRSVLAFVGRAYEEVAEGFCRGTLAESPRGTNGFGYDPIFIPEGEARTYAELTQEEKNRISHRARAFENLVPLLNARLR